MKYSIVTPSFNQADFIEETILSVITQEGDFSIEYIIADGGSTDKSVEIIKRYDNMIKSGKFKPRCESITLKWWSRKDNGQSEAINDAIKIMKGDVVAWINSDDTYTKNAFKEASQAFKNNPDCGAIYSNFYMIDSEGKLIREVPTIEFDLGHLIHRGNIIGQPACFFERGALMKVGLLNPDYHYSMDYDLWIRLGLKYKVKKISGFWANFRLHQDSKTVSQEAKFWIDDRSIVRKYGALYCSPIFLEHYFRNYPHFLNFLTKITKPINDRRLQKLPQFD